VRSSSSRVQRGALTLIVPTWMDPDYLRSTLRPFSASRDLDLVINKAALTVCAVVLLGIAMSLLARIG